MRDGEKESGAPFGEAKTHFIVLAEASFETIETFGQKFMSVASGFKALVDFDARNDAVCGKKIRNSFTVCHMVASGFVKKDNAAQILINVWCGEKEIAIIVAIFKSIGDI